MEYKTLIEIYQSDPGLQKEFPDMTGLGVSGNWDLNSWWNKYGKIDYPNVTLVQPGDPRLTQAAEESKPTTARFEDKDKVYLYDKENKTYRPVDSPEALMALLGTDTTEEAFSYVTVLSPEDMNEPEWQGSIIANSASVKDDGKVPEDSPIVEGSQIGTGSGLQNIYGKTKVSDDTEKYTANLIGFLLTDSKLQGDISDETFDSHLKSNSETLAKYVNAFLYGDYTMQDIYRDLKAKELAAQGNIEYDNYKGFDENMTAEQWYQTEEGKKALADSLLTPPQNLVLAGSDWNNPLLQIPDEAFSTLVSPIDITSPEFKEEMEKIQASYYDIMTQKAEAETEQAKAIADNNWEIFKKNIAKKLNIELSNNAQEAWNQLQQAFSGFSERGLGDSGLFNEAMDKYLGSVRDNDELKREGKIEEEEMELRTHLLKTGSSQEIADFIAEHGEEKAKEWGLIPNDDNDDILAWFSKDNLKSLYPDMSDEEIDLIIGMVVDENGNFKSEMQQNLYTAKYNLQKQKETYQQQKLIEQKLVEEEEAYRPYTESDSIISSIKDTIAKSQEGEVAAGEEETASAEEVTSAQQTPEDWQNKWQNIGGITGFVNVEGTVYAIGEGGGPVSSEEELAWLTPQTGKPLTGNQVQAIPASQAPQYGIKLPKKAAPAPVSTYTPQASTPGSTAAMRAAAAAQQTARQPKPVTQTSQTPAYTPPASTPGSTSAMRAAAAAHQAAPAQTGYGSLVNRGGTIYSGSRGFGSEQDLADYLKIKPHEIDWGRIKKG